MKTFTQVMRYTVLIAITLFMIQCNDKNADNQETVDNATQKTGSIKLKTYKDPKTGSTNIEEGNEAALSVAYIQGDSLYANYLFAKEITDKMISKEESLKATLNQKQRSLQKEADEFNRKLQNNAFLTQERAEQEASRLQQKEIELNNYAQNEYQKLEIENAKSYAQINDSINNFIQEYNKEKRFEMILFKSATLYIDPKYDITAEFVDLLNKRYQASKK